MTTDSGRKKRLRLTAMGALMVGALGIVYGDIGTSPLYALSLTFFGAFKVEPALPNVLGALSLVVWSLILVVTVKYLLLIMRADNHGEGGIFSLLAIIRRHPVAATTTGLTVAALIKLGAALLYGDGVITPAISVLSAFEGLPVYAKITHHPVLEATLDRLVVPLTILVLIALFAVQRKGSDFIGRWAGRIMIVWFSALAVLGVPQIFTHMIVLQAINPVYGIQFLLHHGWNALHILGNVVLCVTGAEALYADMGHFGAPAIRRSWILIVMPALLLNYFGQGARLLDPTPIVNNKLFYSIVPAWGLLPMVVLATLATIIASQALISGCFSMTQEAIAQGIFPRLKIVHTNPEIEGQIYMPFVNWTLMFGCIALVLMFRTSDAFAAAYGIAVTGTMAISTIGFYVVATAVWKWNRVLTAVLCGLLVGIDLVFFSSNILKFVDGGYVPTLIAFMLYGIMHCWLWGREVVRRYYLVRETPTLGEFIGLKHIPEPLITNKAVVVMTSYFVSETSDKIPPPLHKLYKRWGILPRHVVLLHVALHRRPHYPEAERYKVVSLQSDEHLGSVVSVQVNYGYMESPNVRSVLVRLKQEHLVKLPDDPERWTVVIGSENVLTNGGGLINNLRLAVFRFLLRNAKPATAYFGLDIDGGVSIFRINVKFVTDEQIAEAAAKEADSEMAFV